MPRRYSVRVGRSIFAHVRTLTDVLGGLDAITSSLTGSEAITHGIQINAANTGHRGTPTASGIPAGVYTMSQAFLDTYNGGSNVFTGKSLTGVEFQGWATGLAVTFRDCLLAGCAVGLLGQGVTANGLIWFDYCTIYGTLDPYNNPNDFSWSQFAFCNANNMKFTFCDVEGYGSGMLTAGDDCTYEDSYLHDPAPYQSLANGGPQPDGTHHGLLTLQFNTCQRVVIRRCRMKAVRGTTAGWNTDGVSAAQTFYNDSAHPGPFTIVDNYFAGGGGYTSYWGAVSGKPAAYATGITATGNIFGREFERYSGFWGPATAGDFGAGSGNTWSGNTWGPLGVAPNTDPAEGSLVGAPGAL